MNDLLNSVAIYKQLDLPESESDNSNINDILINNNFSQNSTPNGISKCNSNKHIKHKKIKYNNDNDNSKTNIEYNDTIDEYVETTKKKNNISLKPTTNNNNNSKRRTSNTSFKKRPIPSLSKKKPFTTKSTSLKKGKSKSTKAFHNSISSSRSTNNINIPSTLSTAKHSQSKKTNLSITNQHNIKQQTLNTLKAKSNSVSKSTLSSSYQSKNTKTYEQQQHIQPKPSNSSLNKSKQLSQKEFIISNATTIENPTTDNNEQGITQLIFSKDESNETSFMNNNNNNTQRVVPLRKLTRKDSYRHSIMVVQEKLLRKEEEKGENSKISFNDTEFQIRKKRSTLGEFKDVDEHEVKPHPKLKKSSKKFVTHKTSNKAVVVKNENVSANTENVVVNDVSASVNDVNVNVDDIDDQKEFEFNSKHSTIIEENAEHVSTDKKREVNEMDDKFMKLFNEVKGKLLHEKEQLNEQRKCRLTKSNSTPLYNTNINGLLFNSTSNDEINNKKQFIVDILKQSASTTKHSSKHNDNDVKRSINLKHKFKLLKRINDKTINNSINVNNNNSSSSGNTKSMLLKYKHNVNNDILLSETNDKESQYKTFEELKLKAMGTRLILNDLLINKHFEFCDVENDETNSNNNNKRRIKEKYIKYINKSTKAQNYQYKGLNINKWLLYSSLSSFKHDNSQTKVFPPNAMDKSKFNYFIE
jgi:hypothetical protein